MQNKKVVVPTARSIGSSWDYIVGRSQTEEVTLLQSEGWTEVGGGAYDDGDETGYWIELAPPKTKIVITAEKQAELDLAATAFTGDDGYEWLTEGADDTYLAALDTDGIKAYVLDYANIVWEGNAHLPKFEELTVSEFVAASDYAAAVIAVTEAVESAQERIKENKMDVVKTKVILVGRHVSDLPADIEAVEQRNIMWATDAQACMVEWGKLEVEAETLGTAILLQNVPGVLAVAMVRSEKLAREWDSPYSKVKVGVIISVPGPRAAGVVTEYITAEPSLLVKALKDANGRAKVEIISEQRGEYDTESESATLISAVVRLTVDPVAEFKFDHIEWM